MSAYCTFVAGVPRPQGSLTLWKGRDGRERAKYSGPTVAWRQTLHGALSAWWTAPTLGGPVSLSLLFVMPRPKSHYSARGGLKTSAPYWITNSPDLDKMCRAVNDGLTDAGVWADDGQLVDMRALKKYVGEGDRPGVHIALEEL